MKKRERDQLVQELTALAEIIKNVQGEGVEELQKRATAILERISSWTRREKQR